MGELLLWLINQLSYLVTQALNWKIFGDFSFLHFLIAFLILSVLYKFLTFAVKKEGDD